MGLTLVFVGYIIISSGVRILFSPSHSFDGDVLQALPTNSWLALIVRLLMTFVVAMTAPLIVVPCGEMIEGKLGIQLRDINRKERISQIDFLSYCDIGALVIGIITTILTSTMTFGELRRSQQQ
eukprot:scaffold7123_cov134-Skeletonema_menzelii.AAC.1